MALHTIVGAGAIGSQTALELAHRGHTVRVVTRSGSGPEHDSIERIAADASDAEALTRAATGAAALYNCANPPYHHWATAWPPLAAALLTAAERTGAGLVTMGNLYGYGTVSGPMTERTPEAATGTKGRIRVAMWRDALAAHEAGRVRATEARASDFFGPGTAKTSHLTIEVLPRVLAGKRVWMLMGDVDAPHSWTYTTDVATTLATLGTDDRSWGQVWHVPTAPARSVRQVVADLAAVAGVPAPKVSVLPRAALRTAGLVVPMMREMGEVRHQFDHPFVLDSSLATRTFGLAPTPWADALKQVVASAR
jgi:nucleoside-diphosphate-sugar epimerase